MDTLRLLIRETIPCWYELTNQIVSKSRRLMIRIHEEYLASLQDVLPESPAVKTFQEIFGFRQWNGTFFPPTPTHLGFENALRYSDTTDNFREFAITIPRCRKYGEKCRFCNGSGHDGELQRRCLYCEGKRREVIYDYQAAFATSASLSILLSLLHYPHMTTSCKLPQLLTVRTMTDQSSNGSSLFGMYGIELVQFLRKHPNQKMVAIEEAMKGTWRRLEGRVPKYQECSFRSYVDESRGRLIIDCPGDATGLHPNSDFSFREDVGYEFSCHNVDNPMQQLTLLSGLAALHDLARAELSTAHS